MRTKLLIVLVVLGLVAVGLSAFNPSAVALGPPHVVDGAVGNNPAPGGGNPGNVASAVFYLTNKPAEPIQTQADINDGDGVNMPYYGSDVGSAWNWAAGDEVVVVVETIRNQNGWNGPNWTTSSDGILTTNNVDSLAQATHEQVPVLGLNKGPTYVDVTWTGLADGNGNVVNYTVYRAPTVNGPWTMIGRSGPQMPSGAMSYSDTGRPQGQWCYKIAVNYRQDATGGWYTTTGTSEAQCVTIGAAPFLLSTSPVDGEIGVALNAPIVVTFSEPMNIATVTWTVAPPGITFSPTWDALQQILTLNHVTPFTQCQAYTVTIQGRDQNDDFPLDPLQGAPNPWTFTALCPFPQVTLTDPVDGAIGVPRTQDVVITFSKAMNTATVAVTGFSFDGSVWNPGRTVLTLSHTTAFAVCTQYTLTVAGDDDLGNPLVPGPVPNPWSFTANCLPTVSISSPPSPPTPAVDWTGGSVQTIAWTMTDEATAVDQLIVWINYTYPPTGGGAIASAQTGLSSPATWAWTLPTINQGTVAVCIDALDGAGDVGSMCGGPFQIDSTAPTVVSATPTATASPTATLVITFSEAMGRAATVSAFIVSPTFTNTSAWSGTVPDTVLTITPSAALSPGTYTATIRTTARDASTPGNTLATQYSWTFTVASPSPNPPSAVTVTSASQTTVDVSWTAPTTYTDNSALSASDIRGYYIERSTSATGPWTNLTTAPRAGTSFQDTNLAAGTTYYYRIQTVLVNDRVSAWTTPASAQTLVSPSDLTWLWILLIIIIVVVILAALLAWRRKKPAEAPAAPEEVAPSEPETPSEPTEEPAAPEEGGEGGGSGST